MCGVSRLICVAGTPESGGWTSRELRRILYSLIGLNVVAFDIVELSPAYDTNGENLVHKIQSIS
jgi:arginase family enzyme